MQTCLDDVLLEIVDDCVDGSLGRQDEEGTVVADQIPVADQDVAKLLCEVNKISWNVLMGDDRIRGFKVLIFCCTQIGYLYFFSLM